MTDGIKRDPKAKKREDGLQSSEYSGTTSEFRHGHYDIPVRVLPWPTAADGDGVTEPPTMDEVWRGRRMQTKYDGEAILTGAPPEWYAREGEWEVTVRLAEGYGSDTYTWPELTPITPTTRLTVETTDPDEVRRRLGEVGRIVEES